MTLAEGICRFRRYTTIHGQLYGIETSCKEDLAGMFVKDKSMDIHCPEVRYCCVECLSALKFESLKHAVDRGRPEETMLIVGENLIWSNQRQPP